MIRFHSIMPVLRVSDIQRALDWYIAVLGFELVRRFGADGGEGDDSAMLSAGATHVLLSTGAHLGGEPRLTGTIYFQVSGVDELYSRLKDRVTLVWPLEDQEYGTREFGVRDPDGYVLAFCEESCPSDEAGIGGRAGTGA
jgi:uncharacterized glyoxalase superfamily protein PhnB